MRFAALEGGGGGEAAALLQRGRGGRTEERAQAGLRHGRVRELALLPTNMTKLRGAVP